MSFAIHFVRTSVSVRHVPFFVKELLKEHFLKQFQEILLEEGIENALWNSKFEKSASKSAKRCTFEILNPKS